MTRLQWQADEGERHAWHICVWPAIVLMSALSSAGAAQSAGGDGARFAQSPQYPLLPRALEIELALSAAPTHLRGGAAVWVLDKSGYAIAKKGGNPFACVVSRRAGDLFPVCWDAEGTRARSCRSTSTRHSSGCRASQARRSKRW